MTPRVASKAAIRKARIDDVEAIQAIVNHHAERGLMLFRSLAEVYEHLREFSVACIDGRVVGCVAVPVIWADLAEVRSLAVAQDFIGRGIGAALVTHSVREAGRLGIRRVMALTYQQRFFERLGFKVVQKESLPLKVWTDCIHCTKQNECDEIAVLKVIGRIRPGSVPAAEPTPRGVSVPVIQIDE